MEKFSKKTLLNYVNGAGLYGAAPTGSSVVKFAWASTLDKIGTGDNGTITFYADANKTGIIAVGDQIVSSKIFDVTAADKAGGKAGEKTITVTYFDAASKTTKTTPFDVVNADAAKKYFEDYFANSKTIAITDGTADVKVDGQTILIDSASKYLKSGLNIAYISEVGKTGATIALRDKSNNVLSSIAVSDIVGDGVLKDSIYHDNTGILELRFGNGTVYDPADTDTYTKAEVNLKKIIDWNDFLIGAQSENYLGITPSADSSVITLNTKMQDPSTATEDVTGLADAWKVKQYVDSKSTALAVQAKGDDYVDASVDATNNKKINVAATNKTKTAVALAETAIQSVVEGTSVESYVALNISAKGDTSVITITTDDSSLSTKFTEVDASIDALQAKDVEIDSSIDALQTKDVKIDASIDALQAKDKEIDSSIDALQAKDVEIDASIDRLDGSVSAIETAIAGMDADLSQNVLNGSIGITLKEENGKVTTIGVTATKADVTFDNSGDKPSLTSTSGLLAGDSIAPIKNYIDTIAKQGFDGLDSQIVESDASSYVTVTTGIVDGKLLDASSAVAVQYADLTAAPSEVTVNTDGIVRGTDVKSVIEGVLKWVTL